MKRTLVTPPYHAPRILDESVWPWEDGCVTTSFDLDDGTEIIGDENEIDW